jgi:hypothetical protein
MSERQLRLLETRLMQQRQRTRTLVQRLGDVMWWIGPVVAVAGALLLVVRTPDSAWRPRGDGTAQNSTARVRILCASAQGIRGDVSSDTKDAKLVCGLQDRLAFSVTVDTASAAHYLFIVGQSPAGDVRWYHPQPSDLQSVTLPAPVTHHLLPPVQLNVNHLRGWVTLYAVFSDGPLMVEQIRNGLQAGSLEDALPVGTMVQRVAVKVE